MTSVSAPVAEMLNVETLGPPRFPPAFTAKRNEPLLSKVRNIGDPLFGDVVAASRVRAPSVPIEKPVMRFVLGFDVYRNWPLGEIASPLCPEVLSDKGKPASGARAPVVELKE